MLAPGTRLGVYEVVAPLGAGGMGEVYKAKDTRLDRFVAIKVLPAHVSSDPALRERFEREARTVAALILGVESPDRAAVEARKAMELDERHWLPYYAMSMNHFRRGELREAREFAGRSAAAAPSIPLPAALLAGLLRQLGEHDDAEALLSQLRSPSGMFIYHAVCSEMDAAADSLAQAIAQGEMQPLVWFSADFLRPLRSTVRWPALARMMNLPLEPVSN